MKKLMFLVVVALVVVLGCGGNTSEGQKPTGTTGPVVGATQLSQYEKEYEKEQNLEKANKEISRSQEIPTGEENFQKLADYILKHGFNIYGGNSKQYTFFDSKRNRHAYIAQMDPLEKTSKVGRIVVYGYYQGIKDQKHFFPYEITKEKVFCPILELDGSWKDVEAVTFGYKEFLRKVEN